MSTGSAALAFLEDSPAAEIKPGAVDINYDSFKTLTLLSLVYTSTLLK